MPILEAMAHHPHCKLARAKMGCAYINAMLGCSQQKTATTEK